MRNAGKLDSLESDVAALQLSMKKCHSDTQAMKNSFAQISSRLKYVEYKTIDLEATSRQNNLLFHGLLEWTRNGEHEDTETLVREFLSNFLKLDSGDTMEIHNAYRLGSLRKYHCSAPASRPIIVVFKEYVDTEAILDRAWTLKGTAFGISRDYPRELNDARKRLLPMLRQARRANKSAKIHYPAKLIVSGEVTKDEFPDWDRVVDQDEVLIDIGQSPFRHFLDSQNDTGTGSDVLFANDQSSDEQNHPCTDEEWTVVGDDNKRFQRWKNKHFIPNAHREQSDGTEIISYSAWKRAGGMRSGRTWRNGAQ